MTKLLSRFLVAVGKVLGYTGAYAILGVKYLLSHHAAALVPVWVALATAVAARWWMPLCLVWALAGLLVGRFAARIGGAGSGASVREWELLGGGLIVGGIWMLLTAPLRVRPDVPLAWVQWAVLVVLALMFAVPWWYGRRIRAHEEQAADAVPDLPWLVTVWPAVVAELPQMDGTWDLDQWDVEKGMGIIVLAKIRADAAMRYRDEVERILATAVPDVETFDGALKMRPAPDKPVNHLQVMYLADPRARGKRVDYVEGPDDEGLDVDEAGTFHFANTVDDTPWRLPVRRADGTSHLLISGATGSGKGGACNLIGHVFARTPWIYLIACDLKGGTGIPALRGGADIYARTVEEVRAAIEIACAIMDARKDRYGRVGNDTWHPRDDPMIALLIDEAFRIRQEPVLRALVHQLETYAAQARSLGGQLTLTSQVVDVESAVSDLVRSNIMGGGTALMYRPGSATARQIAQQDFRVDLRRLPKTGGWCIPLSGVEDSAQVQIRGRFIPTDKNAQDGRDAPYGTVQQWMASHTRRAVLHPDDARIAARFAAGSVVVPSTVVEPPSARVPAQRSGPPAEHGVLDRVLLAAHDLGMTVPGRSQDGPRTVPADTVGEPSPVRERFEAGSADVPSRARACLPDEEWGAPRYATHRKVHAVLAGAETPLARGDIARQIEASPGWVGRILAELRSHGHVEQTNDTRWRVIA